MKGGLAIFVKTPGVSPLKTRLALGIGEDSQRWYGMAVEAVKSVTLQAREKTGIEAYWAIAEMQAMQSPRWQSLPRLAQADDAAADLGERMGKVMRMLVRQHGFGLLLGADAPQICVEDIEAATEYLNHDDARIVLGPARDGGFWCVGSNRKLPIELWQSVVYSQANTCRDFIAAFSPFAEILNLRLLSDVDEVGDLVICHREMQTLAQPTSEQSALLEAFGAGGLAA